MSAGVLMAACAWGLVGVCCGAEDSNVTRVAVIGAGAAGLSAARTLVDNWPATAGALDLVVIEARDRCVYIKYYVYVCMHLCMHAFMYACLYVSLCVCVCRYVCNLTCGNIGSQAGGSCMDAQGGSGRAMANWLGN